MDHRLIEQIIRSNIRLRLDEAGQLDLGFIIDAGYKLGVQYAREPRLLARATKQTDYAVERVRAFVTKAPHFVEKVEDDQFKISAKATQQIQLLASTYSGLIMQDVLRQAWQQAHRQTPAQAQMREESQQHIQPATPKPLAPEPASSNRHTTVLEPDLQVRKEAMLRAAERTARIEAAQMGAVSRQGAPVRLGDPARRTVSSKILYGSAARAAAAAAAITSDGDLDDL